MASESFDVLVLGRGILGLTVALTLTTRDPALRIGVIGEQDGASHAAGAMLGCFGEVTAEALATEGGRAKHELAVAAARRWHDWSNELAEVSGEPIEINPGTFVLHNADSGTLDDGNYAAIVGALNAADEPFETVDLVETTIPGVNPTPRSRPLSAMFIPGEGSIDARKVLHALERALERVPSAVLIDGRAGRIVVEDGRLDHVLAADGSTYRSDRVIITTGAGTSALVDDIAELADRVPRIVAGSGTALELVRAGNGLTSVVRTPNRAFACGLHCVPHGNDTMYVGATNWPRFGADVAPMVSHVHFLLTCAFTQINRRLSQARIARLFCGQRPVPIDTLPLIGPTSIEGLWFLTGTYRDGFHMSPILADMLVRGILENESPLDPVFAPERRLSRQWTKTDAIEASIAHYMASFHENPISLPAGWEQPVLESLVRERMVQLYDRIDFGSDFVLPPDFAGELLLNPDACATVRAWVEANLAAWSDEASPRPPAAALQ